MPRKLSLLAALLFFALSGCGSMSDALKKGLADLSKEAACAASVLSCQELGGTPAMCEKVRQGCMVIGDKVVKRVVSAKELPTSSEVAEMTTRAFGASPFRATLRTRTKPGFRTPITDSKPVEMR